jgi:hypothetical protein
MKRIVLLVCALAVAFAVALGAADQAMRMTVGQLKGFLRSSIQMKHTDKQVADYLKNVRLTEKLTESDIQELQNEGLGPKASDALRTLISATANLPKPAVDPVKVPAAPMPPPPDADQKRVVEEAREVALGYTKRLPDFICLQVTHRYIDPSGLEMFQKSDTIATRLSYFEQREDYKLISVNGTLSQADYSKLGGATSTGEFGTMLRQIFEPETQTEFWWERWAKLRGKIAYVFGYRVRQQRSQWHITWQRQMDIVTGYHGLIYVDKEVPTVLRVTLEAEEMPPSFPIQEARSMLDYDYQTIADKEFLLPLRAEMRMREGRFLIKNLTEFRSYRKFGTESTITFDTRDLEPLSDDKVKEKPPNK